MLENFFHFFHTCQSVVSLLSLASKRPMPNLDLFKKSFFYLAQLADNFFC